jgi:hypothetical protein
MSLIENDALSFRFLSMISRWQRLVYWSIELLHFFNRRFKHSVLQDAFSASVFILSIVSSAATTSFSACSTASKIKLHMVAKNRADKYLLT